MTVWFVPPCFVLFFKKWLVWFCAYTAWWLEHAWVCERMFDWNCAYSCVCIPSSPVGAATLLLFPSPESAFSPEACKDMHAFILAWVLGKRCDECVFINPVWSKPSVKTNDSISTSKCWLLAALSCHHHTLIVGGFFLNALPAVFPKSRIWSLSNRLHAAMVWSNTYWPDQFAPFHRKCQHLHRSCSASSAQFWMRSVTYAGFLFECAGCAPLDEKDKNIKYSQHTLSLCYFFWFTTITRGI